MGLKTIICAVVLVSSVGVGTAASASSSTSTTTMRSTSSTLPTTPHAPGLGDSCDGVCSPNKTVVCVNRTCQCRPPRRSTTDKYCVTAPDPVVDFAITKVSNNTVWFTWGPPTDPGNIQEYHLFAVTDHCADGLILKCPDRQSSLFYNRTYGCRFNWYTQIDCNANSSFYTPSLLSYTNYTFIISANNDLYYGPNTTLIAQTSISAAEPPRNIIGNVENSTSILVQWDTPRHETGPTWYTVTVLEATGRQSSDFTATNTCRVDGFHSTSLQVTGLLPSWVYFFTVTAHTVAGDSQTVNTTDTVTTLPSAPGPIVDLKVTALDIPLMGVKLTWNCPGERKRNGLITSYSVNYTGAVFATQKYGMYYPEDPCTSKKSLVIPITPGVNYTFTISANAEFQGEKTTAAFPADPQCLRRSEWEDCFGNGSPPDPFQMRSSGCDRRLAYLLPANVIKIERDSTSSTPVIAVGVVCGVIIVVLSVVFIMMTFHVRRHYLSQKESVNSQSKDTNTRGISMVKKK